jgi:hypothetical protein
MLSDRWRQISDVYDAALARPTADRAAFLDEACAGDTSLRSEIELLLSLHSEFLDIWLGRSPLPGLMLEFERALHGERSASIDRVG